jgi:hypothetical protein
MLVGRGDGLDNHPTTSRFYRTAETLLVGTPKGYLVASSASPVGRRRVFDISVVYSPRLSTLRAQRFPFRLIA